MDLLTLTGFVSVLLGNRDGTFQDQRIYAVGYDSWFVNAGDFNSNIKLDLVITNKQDWTASVLLGNGDETFSKKIVYTVGRNEIKQFESNT